MAIKPETVKTFEQIPGQLDEFDKAQTKIAPKLKDLESKVRADAKLDKPQMGEVHLAALAKLIRDIDNAKQTVKGAEVWMSQVLKDADFVDEKLDEITPVKKRQEDAQQLLSNQYKLAKELENLAEESLEKEKGGADEALDQISQLELIADNLTDTITETTDQVNKIQERAYAAQMARDAKNLADAQKDAAAIDLKSLKEQTAMMVKMVEALKQMTADTKDKDPKALAQVKDSLNDINKLIAKSDTTVSVAQAFQQNVKVLKIVPIDVSKAMKVLALPPAAKDKLAKVLKGPAADFEDGFDDLIKALKLKDTTGKKMREQLEKGNVL